ncbi:MAG: ABC transporter ATP-binding protein [Planctomycetes bacterium]|nr:ABC transporter ATP-binding protein [Planctomycetota bacterium]
MASVTLEGVSCIFPTKGGVVRAVDDISLSVADREFVVLVGPSGCGKTTTLRLIAGLEEPSAGTIRIGDQNVDRVPPRDRDVAMVFQNYALYPHMTVFKNMAFGLKMRKVPKDQIRRKVGEVSEMLGLSHLLQRKPADLSGGEAQRVALGRAIVRRPKVFLFDEPLSNLDARLRLNMRAELKALHRELQTTMIYVTHDQEEAMTLGDRVAVLKDGRIQQCDDPMTVYEKPANVYVAGSIGTPLMNLFHGRLEENGVDLTFTGKACRIVLPSDAAKKVRSAVGRPVVLGIRPQDLQIAGADPSAFGTSPSAPMRLGEAVVRFVEPLGDRMNVHADLSGGVSVVVRTAPRARVSAGESVTVFLYLSRAHWFAGDADGVRLA